MIPFRDNIPSNRAPILTLAIIGLNVLAFLYETGLPETDRERLIYRCGVIPREFAIIGKGPELIRVEEVSPLDPRQQVRVHEYEMAGTLAGAVIPLFTSMFLHGGWTHLIGNMWFLWLFG